MYLPFFAAFAASFLLLNFSLAYPKAALSSINPEAFHPRILMAKVNAKKNKDGSCYSHTVASGETCQFMMDKFSITKNNLMQWNKNNFGWMGCDNGHPWIGDKVCVSDGTPPKPAHNKLAECGPQASTDGTNIKCPLNACCSPYGFCGLTSDFCAVTKSPTGAPGTAGCLSNCGYGKVHTDTRSDFKKIVYWLDANDKLRTDPKALKSYYSVHYSFVNIKSDLTIDDSKIAKSTFLGISNKKIASFGGWEFSTSASTYNIFRNGVADANREKFATNLVNFLKKYNLDGIDLDWEFPGLSGIPGIPDDDKKDGQRYLELLKLIKSKLPAGKTLSITIPASFWYLKNFPITDMQKYIDYQVFMTYDIRGTNSDNIVQCHTNKTEVINALQMLDKAGVQIGKTYGGLANYGRSYKLSSTSCSKVGCPVSGPGKKGPIVNTDGVLAQSEIDDIKTWGVKNKRWTDETSQCDFMIYDSNNIVGWPKAGQRNSMEDFFHHSGLAGSVLWAANYN